MSLLHQVPYRRADRGVPLLSVLAMFVLCQSSAQTPQATATLQGGRFLSRSDGAAATAVYDLSPAMQSALGAIFGGWGEEAATRLAFVVAALRPVFDVQPKDAGHIGSDGSRAVAYSYFAQEHGWLIKGLEPPYMLRSSQDLHEVSVLRKAPVMVEALIENQRQNSGLTLGDLGAAVTAIERLLVDESMPLLEAAYDLNGEDVMDWIKMESLHEILQSYLLLFRQGSHANLVDSKVHQEMKARARQKEDSWSALTEFESKAVSRFSEGAMELTRQYSFEDVAQIAKDLALLYGKWQDVECKSMSTDLRALDAQGTGTVPFATFHEQKRNPVYGYKFTETVEYLRTTGALEEQAGGEPRVLIVNYVLGPSNCIATSQFASVCCLNTCEALAGELWKEIRAPAVDPAVLMAAARNLSTPLVETSKEQVFQELRDIATGEEGMVTLSTPGFRQWLHHAFPGRCPSLYPSSQAAPPPVEHKVGPQKPASPTIPPSHRPNAQDCTRVPEYFL